MGNLPHKKITVSEYFEIERNSLERHEVHEGQNFLGNFLFFFVSFALFVVKRMLLHSPLNSG